MEGARSKVGSRRVLAVVKIAMVSVQLGRARANAVGIHNTCLLIAKILAMPVLAPPVTRRARSAEMLINNVLPGQVLANVREILRTWM